MQWRAIAEQIGAFSNSKLQGLPLGGALDATFSEVIGALKASGVSPLCQDTIQHIVDFQDYVFSSTDPLSGDVVIADLVAATIPQSMQRLRSDCLDADADYVSTVAWATQRLPLEVIASLSTEDQRLIGQSHFVDAIQALVLDRRRNMGYTEAALFLNKQQPWSKLRVFTGEEDADDVSVMVLRAIEGVKPTALGEFLFSLLPDDDARSECDGLIKTGKVPPYGVDLEDEHHASCWRVYHLEALAKNLGKKRAPRPRPVTTEFERPTASQPFDLLMN
jgi:hypothetical protein